MLHLLAMVPALQMAPLRGCTPGVRSRTVMQVTKTVTPLPATVKPGVVTGQALKDLLQHAKDNGERPAKSNVLT